MKAFFNLRWLVLLFMCWSGGALVFGVTPAELQKRLAQGERIAVIDIRSTTLFQKGHIPGAINIPALLLPAKKLPPLGKAVVCEEGLGKTSAEAAVVELNKKPGISAEILEGGFAAWENMQAALTTREPGMKQEEQTFITYHQLKAAQSDDVVLVDLRKDPPQTRQGAPTASPPAPVQPLTDLRKEFSQVRGITRSPFDLPQVRQSNTPQGNNSPLLVLIDNGDGGSAREMARTLKANGMKRVVILAGGEEILSRGGQPGLQRRSSGAGVITDLRPKGANP